MVIYRHRGKTNYINNTGGIKMKILNEQLRKKDEVYKHEKKAI